MALSRHLIDIHNIGQSSSFSKMTHLSSLNSLIRRQNSSLISIPASTSVPRTLVIPNL